MLKVNMVISVIPLQMSGLERSLLVVSPPIRLVLESWQLRFQGATMPFFYIIYCTHTLVITRGYSTLETIPYSLGVHEFWRIDHPICGGNHPIDSKCSQVFSAKMGQLTPRGTRPDPRLPGPCPASEDLAEPSASPVPGMPLPGQEHVKMTWLGYLKNPENGYAMVYRIPYTHVYPQFWPLWEGILRQSHRESILSSMDVLIITTLSSHTNSQISNCF